MSYGDLAAWIASLTTRDGLSGSTVRKCLVLTRKILDTAVLDGYLPRNPAAGIKAPSAAKKETRFLTREDVSALVRSADYLDGIKRPGRRTDLHPVEELPRDERGRATIPDDVPASTDGLLIDVLAATGCRWGEIAALRVGRCELDRTDSETSAPAPRLRIEQSVSEVGSKRGTNGGSKMEFSKTKSGKARSVAIPPRMAQRLATHIDGRGPDEFVFPDANGGPLRNTVWSKRVFRRACDLAGLDRAITIHSLRHHYASVAMSRGADPVRVARQLGHSTPTVTMSVYSHVHERGLDDLARLFEDD
ncbi:tyrosine-type recombinase/integrase [Rhodococcus hoagii]|nr:tyrosine-type recombinase/integrase [Prescottella equi]